MASRGGKSSNVRRRKLARRGKDSKRARDNKGTTPKFPVHVN